MPQPDAPRALAAALGRIPSGLFVLTARRGESETGMLASWIQQCSFDPPQVTIALSPDRPLVQWLVPGSACTVNILDDTQTDMIGHFGRGFELAEPAFAGLEIERRPDAGPILLEALAYLDAEVVSRHPGGDHDVYVCKVTAGALLNEGRPMVHVRKSGGHY